MFILSVIGMALIIVFCIVYGLVKVRKNRKWAHCILNLKNVPKLTGELSDLPNSTYYKYNVKGDLRDTPNWTFKEPNEKEEKR